MRQSPGAPRCSLRLAPVRLNVHYLDKVLEGPVERMMTKAGEHQVSSEHLSDRKLPKRASYENDTNIVWLVVDLSIWLIVVNSG